MDLVAFTDLTTRRREAFLAGGRSAMIEATTLDDIRLLHEARDNLHNDARAVLDMYVDVWSEFTRGDRCSVCGRTEKQNVSIGYDCVREC